MYFELIAALLSISLLAAMLGSYGIGRRVRLRHIADGVEEISGAGVVEGAVFALLGLLLAFSFAGAASRFDDRRKLIVEEANAIGTAYLRLDLLAPAARDELRSTLRDYVDGRLSAYRALPDIEAATAELARSASLQQQIWSKAVSAASGVQPATMLLLPALNEMFDITTTRTAAALSHPPLVLFVLLFLLCLLGAFIAGYAMGASKLSRMHVVMLAVTLAAVFYIIIDLEFPRAGLIRVDDFDHMLVDVRRGMR